MVGRPREEIVGPGAGGIAFKMKIEGMDQVVEQMDKGRKAADAEAQAMTGLRTSLLFLSFGMLAAGGLMSRASMQFRKAMGDMVEAYTEVEHQSVVVGTIMNANEENTRALRQEMIRLGRDTEWTAAQAGEAMRELAMSGLSFQETMGAARGVLKLATIGLVDTAAAANLAVGVLRGFNLNTATAADTAGSMTVVVSELAQAATHSAATVDQFAEALKFASAAAEAAGISMEETLAVLMIASDNMVRAGLAGRALRRSLIRLQQAAGGVAEETKGVQEMLDTLGLSLVDETGNVKSLADVVDELNGAMSGMATAERNSALAALFGAESITMWSALLREGGDAIRERELGLTAAAAKEAIFMRFSEDSTQLLLRWREQVSRGTVDTADLARQLSEMGFAGEEIDAIISTITVDLENADSVIRDAAIASEVTAKRLETLKGTTEMFKSSLEALYASISQEIAPIFLWWNKLLKALADWMLGLPTPIKVLIGVLVIVGYLFTTIGSKILLTTGTLVMMAAAVVLLNKQMGKGMTSAMLFKEAFGALGIAARQTAVSLSFLALKLVAVTAAAAGLILEFMFLDDAMKEGNYWVAAATAGMIALEIATVAANIASLHFTTSMRVLNATVNRHIIAQKIYNALLVLYNKLMNITALSNLRAWVAMKLQTLQMYAQIMATRLATIAQWNWNLAMRASPILFLIGAIAAMAGNLPFLTVGLTAVAIATWAWNASLYANPIVLIITAIFALIMALVELVRHLKEVTEWFKAGWDWMFGSPDTIFDHVAWGASAAQASVADLGNTLKSTNKEWAKSVKLSEMTTIGGPRAPPATVNKGVSIINPSLSVNLGGVKIAGPMQEDQLKNVINQAADEAMKRWNASFAAESEEVTR